jgi:hypothetical protein
MVAVAGQVCADLQLVTGQHGLNMWAVGLDENGAHVEACWFLNESPLFEHDDRANSDLQAIDR